jgi:hypothetical protein
MPIGIALGNSEIQFQLLQSLLLDKFGLPPPLDVILDQQDPLLVKLLSQNGEMLHNFTLKL